MSSTKEELAQSLWRGEGKLISQRQNGTWQRIHCVVEKADLKGISTLTSQMCSSGTLSSYTNYEEL
jgi:hypothetical protein